MVSLTSEMSVVFYTSSSTEAPLNHRLKSHVLALHRKREQKTGLCRILLLKREGEYLTPYDRTRFYTYIMLKCLKWQSHLFCPQAISKKMFYAYTWGLGNLFP